MLWLGQTTFFLLITASNDDSYSLDIRNSQRSLAPVIIILIYCHYNICVVQICQKLIHFEGEAKKSMVRSTMKWWSKCISMIISKTTSRNPAFKASRMNGFLMANEGQVKVRSFNDERSGNQNDSDRQVYDEIECNSDLYILNQLVDHD